MEFVRKVGGHPFLYADQFITEEEFDEIFDLTLWSKCRARYGAEGNFPTLWEKIRPELDIISVADETLFVEDDKKQQ